MSYVSEKDYELGKVVKKYRLNPVGEDVYLMPDGTIEKDEDKIVKAQRIFLHNWYRPGGPGPRMVLEKYGSRTDQETDGRQQLNQNDDLCSLNGPGRVRKSARPSSPRETEG